MPELQCICTYIILPTFCCQSKSNNNKTPFTGAKFSIPKMRYVCLLVNKIVDKLNFCMYKLFIVAHNE